MTRVAYSTPSEQRALPLGLLNASPIDSTVVFAYGRPRDQKAVYRRTDDGWLLSNPGKWSDGIRVDPVSSRILVETWGTNPSLALMSWSLHHPGRVRVVVAGENWRAWICCVCGDHCTGFDSVGAAGDDARAHLRNHAEIVAR